MKQYLAIAAAGLMAAACTTTDPYTGEAKRSNTARNATIGAVVGAVGGALTNTNSGEQALKNAAIGAAAGAAVGGGIGAYQDRQEAKLRAKLQGSGVSVTRVGNDIVLNMPSNVTFATDQFTISNAFYDTLESVALVLKEFNQTSLNVAGHTDSTGSDSYNQQLSEKRAGAVANFLISNDVNAARVRTYGFGESRPIADNSTDFGRQQNRRVEITIAPSGA
ncbi:MAG: OmpA family protein [Pseudomonadota bacterium]